MTDSAGEKVLVTGGAGFIGYHLCIKLLEEGARVLVYDDLSAERSRSRFEALRKLGARCQQASVLDYSSVQKATRGVHLVFHLAAKVSVRESMVKPLEYLRTNCIGAANVLKAASESGCPVIFTSSSTIYGIARRYPTPEDEELRPISFYGLSKLIAERFCGELEDLPVVRLRLFNVYGPEGGGVVFDFLRKLSKNPLVLEVIGSGRQSKDFIYIDDVVDALLKSASRLKEGCYNVGSGRSYAVSEIADEILKQLGLLGKTRVVYQAQPNWPGDVEFTLADTSKITFKLNWRPSVDLQEGIARTISWFERKVAPIKRRAARS